MAGGAGRRAGKGKVAVGFARGLGYRVRKQSFMPVRGREPGDHEMCHSERSEESAFVCFRGDKCRCFAALSMTAGFVTAFGDLDPRAPHATEPLTKKQLRVTGDECQNKQPGEPAPQLSASFPYPVEFCSVCHLPRSFSHQDKRSTPGMRTWETVQELKIRVLSALDSIG